MASVISYKLEIDDNNASAKLQNLEKKFEETANNSKKVFDEALGVFLGNLLTGAASQITSILSKGFQDFLDKQRFYSNFGNIFGEASKELEEFNNNLQKTTIFAADSFAKIQVKLSTFVSSTEQLKTLSLVIADIAAASGKSIEQVADMITATLAGRVSLELKQLGFEIDNAANASERLNQIIAQSKQLYGGFAEQSTKTLSGIIQQLKNNLEDFIPNLINNLAPFLDKMAKLLKDINEYLTDSRVMKVFDVIVKGTIAGFELVYRIIESIVETIYNSFFNLGNFLYTVLIKPFVNLYNLTKEIFEAVKLLMEGNIGEAIEKLKTNISATLEIFKKDISNAGKYFKDAIVGGLIETKNNFEQYWKDVKELSLYKVDSMVNNINGSLRKIENKKINIDISILDPAKAIQIDKFQDIMTKAIENWNAKNEKLFKQTSKIQLQWETEEDKNKRLELENKAKEIGETIAYPISNLLRSELINAFEDIFGRANSLLEKFLAAMGQGIMDLLAKKAAASITNFLISGIGMLLGVPIGATQIANNQIGDNVSAISDIVTNKILSIYGQNTNRTIGNIYGSAQITNNITLTLDKEIIAKQIINTNNQLLMRYV